MKSLKTAKIIILEIFPLYGRGNNLTVVAPIYTNWDIVYSLSLESLNVYFMLFYIVLLVLQVCVNSSKYHLFKHFRFFSGDLYVAEITIAS